MLEPPLSEHFKGLTKKLEVKYIFQIHLQVQIFVFISCLNVWDVEEWPKILLKSCAASNKRFLNHVFLFFNIMHELVKLISLKDLQLLLPE